MSRERMLARVRAALGRSNGAGAGRTHAVAARLAHPPRHPRPAFACTEGAEREARLIQCLKAQGTDVIAIDSIAALPAAVAMLLDRAPSSSPLVGEDRGEGESRTPACVAPPTPNPSQGGGGPTHLVIGNDARLTALAWPDTRAPALWSPDQTLGDGTAALTHAWAAVAETGTLVLWSNAASPASLAFLPELHIVALAREAIAASFEDAFARLASESGTRRLPRAVNLVSSASRTGDIGGKIVKGAHGPRRLAVVLYGKSPQIM